ncbi:putative potassium channel regulatory protein unc-93 [Caerostris darwini]|uniref:Potassium channel regulatory protein unc-93 n=1 Tax=Caerostris darwini TaxID=1538125 RepID=A0AAV4XAC8_9ARAC|nr:putative potassium channel regulatory protein unc-93 [Caerostris darwini]
MELTGTGSPKFSKLGIVKNLTLLSMSFLFLFTAYNGLSMLQTTMNRAEGIGTISQAAIYILYGLSSLSLSSYTVKKLGTKICLITGMISFVPYIAANFYPSWITLIPSAVLLGMGTTIMWGAQSTYINESSKMYCALAKKDDCHKAAKEESKGTNAENPPELSNPSNVEKLSAQDLTLKIEDIHKKIIQEVNADTFQESGITCRCKQNRLSNILKDDTHQRFEVSKKDTNKYAKSIKIHGAHENYDFESSNKSYNRINEVYFSQFKETNFDAIQTQTSSSSIGNINAIFFGFHYLLYATSQIWSNLLSFYVLRSDSKEVANNPHNCSCGAAYCNANLECFSPSSQEVSKDARYLLTGICVAFAGCAVLLNFFLDPIKQKKETVTFSWSHVFATAKFNTRKEQVLLMPLTLFASMCQGFYTADFTKSYIGCAWSTSHIGLVTVFYGLAAAVSSLFSGYVIKFVGRKCVFVVCQAVSTINLVFMLLWKPGPQQYLLFYLAGSLWGINTGVLMAQLRAFYGVLFQGEEETAFASFNMYSGGEIGKYEVHKHGHTASFREFTKFPQPRISVNDAIRTSSHSAASCSDLIRKEQKYFQQNSRMRHIVNVFRFLQLSTCEDIR